MNQSKSGKGLGNLFTLGALLLLGAGLVSVYFAWGLPIDNRIERWMDRTGPGAGDYGQFRRLFGSDEFVVVAYSGGPFFSDAALDVQLSVLETLESIPDVVRVYGIPGVFRERFGGENPEALAEEFTSTPFYQNFLIARDETVAGLLVETAQPKEAAGRRVLMEAIRAALEPLRANGYDIHLAGPPLLNAVLDETSEKESRRIFPVAFVCAMLVLAVSFRSVRAAAVAVFCASWTVLLTLGLMGAAGRPLNMVTSVLPSLLWVLALSNMVHVLQRYRHHHRAFPEPGQAMARAMADTASPCALASLTTAFGFLSLGMAEMAPIRELGLFAAAGMVVSLGVNLCLGSWLTILLRTPPSRQASKAVHSLAACVTGLAARHALIIVSVSVVLLGLCALAACWIRVESDPLSFLPEESATVADYNFVGTRLTGYYSLELVVHLNGGCLDPAHWPPLEKLREGLEATPGVARVLSPLDILKKLNHWDHEFEPDFYRLPDSRDAAEALLGELDDTGKAEWRRLVSGSNTEIRLSALINVMDSRRFGVVTDRAKGLLSELPQGMGGYCTGMVYQLVSAQTSLVRSQLRSIGAAFCLIFLCIFIGLRSWRLTLVSILPNALPIFAAFALMFVFNIALDGATVMMASVALGIAVDDTVHLLSVYRRSLGGGMASREAVEAALSETGIAMVMTTVTACVAFFTLMRSSFVPIAWFGMLSGAAMLVALAADVFLGPALLLLRGRAARQ